MSWKFVWKIIFRILTFWRNSLRLQSNPTLLQSLRGTRLEKHSQKMGRSDFGKEIAILLDELHYSISRGRFSWGVCDIWRQA